uniref:Uncharacterized protein n=1 Tax=Romanomermis culicivorax TaxID=13658 RepID=A0A915K7U7_ROMCU
MNIRDDNSIKQKLIFYRTIQNDIQTLNGFLANSTSPVTTRKTNAIDDKFLSWGHEIALWTGGSVTTVTEEMAASWRSFLRAEPGGLFDPTICSMHLFKIFLKS